MFIAIITLFYVKTDMDEEIVHCSRRYMFLFYKGYILRLFPECRSKKKIWDVLLPVRISLTRFQTLFENFISLHDILVTTHFYRLKLSLLPLRVIYCWAMMISDNYRFKIFCFMVQIRSCTEFTLRVCNDYLYTDTCGELFIKPGISDFD